MIERSRVEELLLALYGARVGASLRELCALFDDEARFRIAGASDGKPIAISACGIAQIRPWLAMLVKSFSIGEHEILSMIIEGPNAAVHWRARIHSKITGSIVQTELVDLIEVRAGRIARYSEFFVPS